MFYREVIFDEKVVSELSFPAFYALNGEKELYWSKNQYVDEKIVSYKR